MNMMVQILCLAAGFVLIIVGGDTFVDAALRIGRKVGISPLILGATLVSLTTTLPELFVSTMASATGHVELAVGNAVGSIICNTGLILGLCSVLSPMHLDGPAQVKKSLLLLGSIVILFVMALQGPIGRIQGILLYALLWIFLMLNFKEMKQDPQENDVPEEFSVRYVLFFVMGAGCIIGGSKLLVDAASALAVLLHVPEKLIALSVVALGTSLPELVTSLSALRKKEAGLSIGNIIGANILNITLVMSTSSIVAPGGLTTVPTQSGPLEGFNQLLVLDVPTALCLGLILLYCAARRKVSRVSGVLLLCIYGGYLGLISWAVL